MSGCTNRGCVEDENGTQFLSVREADGTITYRNADGTIGTPVGEVVWCGTSDGPSDPEPTDYYGTFVDAANPSTNIDPVPYPNVAWDPTVANPSVPLADAQALADAIAGFYNITGDYYVTGPDHPTNPSSFCWNDPDPDVGFPFFLTLL